VSAHRHIIRCRSPERRSFSLSHIHTHAHTSTLSNTNAPLRKLVHLSQKDLPTTTTTTTPPPSEYTVSDDSMDEREHLILRVFRDGDRDSGSDSDSDSDREGGSNKIKRDVIGDVYDVPGFGKLDREDLSNLSRAVSVHTHAFTRVYTRIRAHIHVYNHILIHTCIQLYRYNISVSCIN